MIWLGLLLPLSFVAEYTGASIPTQWAFLSLSLPLALWRSASTPTGLHYLGYAFSVWAFLGILWGPHPLDTVYGLWIVTLWALSFQLGYATRDPRPLWCGLALGVSVSSLLAIPQWFGYFPVLTFNGEGGNIAGLLFNRTVLGAACALLILTLLQARLWLYIPALIPGLLLSGSRGGWLIFAFGLVCRLHWSLGLAGLILASLFFNPGSSDILRLQIWGVALQGLSWHGWSAGSFNDVYFINPTGAYHPEYVHNDYLQLWFEFGIGALVPFTILAFALAWRPSPALWAFALLGAFYFPLYGPLTAFIGCFALGHALRGFSLDGLIIRHCRPDLLSGSEDEGLVFDPAWSKAVPLQQRTSS